MLFDGGSIGLVSSVLIASCSPGPNTFEIQSSKSEVSSLPIASPLKVLPDRASRAALATSSAVLLQAASPFDFARHTLSSSARMGPTSADVASFSLGSLQYSRDRLARRDAKFAKLVEKCIQRKEFVIFLEARLADMEAQLAPFRSDCDALQAANDD